MAYKSNETKKELMANVHIKEKEADIQNAILEYLDYRKYFFWRSNNIAVFDRKNQRFRAMPKFSLFGVADIILLSNGTFYAIEVKTPRGKQSPHQKAFEEMVRENGGVYILATSVDDVQRAGL